jgi:PAT family beta-lactamase induction signal transducer AmpG
VKFFFEGHAPENFAAAVERSGVSPAALGAGYVVFFSYSALIGVFAVFLALAVYRKQERELPDAAARRAPRTA